MFIRKKNLRKTHEIPTIHLKNSDLRILENFLTQEYQTIKQEAKACKTVLMTYVNSQMSNFPLTKNFPLPSNTLKVLYFIINFIKTNFPINIYLI